MKKPTLGYPSRTEAIIGLREKGWSDGAIAAELGMTKGCLSSMVGKWKNTRDNRPIHLNASTFADLRKEARRRNLNPEALANRLLVTICRDQLFDAVLGDEAGE